MKIALLVPGSGDSFYCENCLRDTSVVRALRRLGHDAVLVPLYLPVAAPADTREAPLFFGGVNAWLQQHLGLFRATPRWLDRLFDSPWVLRQAAKRAGSTRASALGPMTLSMLCGEAGRQVKELDRLVAWLAAEGRPDVVHLSNALLLGLARRVREATGAAVVCSLQDEAPWVDAMGPPYADLCWEAMAERAAHVDRFVSVSAWYAGVVAPRLRIPPEEVRVVPTGVEPEAYVPSALDAEPPVLGYLARMSKGCGLGTLVDAWLLLRRDPRFGRLRLRATGGSTTDDEPFLAALRRRIADAGAAADAQFLPEFDPPARRAFLSSLTVLSVPGVDQTAFGLYLVEAMAAGVPVVQPRVGAFPEVVGATGGGVLYDPPSTETLARALGSLLADPSSLRALGAAGRAGVSARFAIEGTARGLSGAYAEALAARGRG